jgi:hypothetical protein
MRKGTSVVVVLSVVISMLLFAGAAFAQATPSVTVRDQAVQNNTVTIERVVAAEAGWIVIHADNNGTPGADIGHTAVRAGENQNVQVTIDPARATPRLYAMLHVDRGTAGTYEFPGADVPVSPLVNPSFNVSGLAAQGTPGATPAAGTPVGTPAAAAQATPTVVRTPTAVATPAAAAQATPAVARTPAPATLPTTGGGSMLVVTLLGLGGLSLLGGLGLSLLRRTR